MLQKPLPYPVLGFEVAGWGGVSLTFLDQENPDKPAVIANAASALCSTTSM